jgi:hypothetical protein
MKMAKIFIVLLVFVSANAAASAKASDINKDLAAKVLFGKAEDAVILIERGADVYSKNSAGIPVLNLAAGRNTEDAYIIINALIKAGADVYSTDSKGNMPIAAAIKTGHPNNVQALINNLAIVSGTDGYGKSMIELAQIRHDPQILAIVTAKLQQEQAELKTLQDPENMKKLVKKLSFLYCSGEYFKYYKRDFPKKLSDEKYKRIVDKNAYEVKDTKQKLVALFGFNKPKFDQIYVGTIEDIRFDLDRLQTPENRAYNGFGSDRDSNTRCGKVAERFSSAIVTVKKKR